jgi:hypothetical protein
MKILCQSKTHSTIGFRSSWDHFTQLNWNNIREVYVQIVGYYTSPRIYSLQRTVRNPDESEFEIRYEIL